jgi:hypothetical protein
MLLGHHEPSAGALNAESSDGASELKTLRIS